MVLNLLREAYAHCGVHYRVSRDLEEGKNIEQVLPKSIDDPAELHLDSKWWLERAFRKIRLSYLAGVIVVYFLVALPRALFLPYIIRAEFEYVTGFIGDLFIPFTLLLVHWVYKSALNVKNTTNEKIKRDLFVSPAKLLAEDNLADDKKLADFETSYRNRYIKPVMVKSAQYGFDLAYNKVYQLFAGLIGFSIAGSIIVWAYATNSFPGGLFMVVNITDSQIRNVFNIWVYSMWAFQWFIIAMATWTLLLVFIANNAISANPIRMKPFEKIKKCFAPNISLVLRTSFIMTFITAWTSPAILLWSASPIDPLIRNGAVIFVASVVTAMVPIIILSFILPLLKIHKGMEATRERLLLIKNHQLDKLKNEKRTTMDSDKYLNIREHLIKDYKDVRENSVWMLNVRQILELSGTVIFPIATFLVSTWI